jgi:hypothetical protein
MIAQSVADILRDRVKLSVEGIDRMYLSCRYRHYKYNAEFRIMPSDFRIPLVGSLFVKTHSV